MSPVTTKPHVTLSAALQQGLAADPQTLAALNALVGRRRLGPQVEAQLGDLQQKAKAVLKKDPGLGSQLDKVIAAVLKGRAQGWVDPVNTVAAAVLSGAAISIPGLPLRPGLDASLTAARTDYQNQLATYTAGSTGGDQGHAGGSGDVVSGNRGGTDRGRRARPPFQYQGDASVATMVDIYSKLTAGTKPNGKLAKGIVALLTDAHTTLRMGPELNTLKLPTTYQYLNQFFRAPIRHQTEGGNHYVPGRDVISPPVPQSTGNPMKDALEAARAAKRMADQMAQDGGARISPAEMAADLKEKAKRHAPHGFALTVPSFYRHPGPRDIDEPIYWVAMFTYVANLRGVYDVINNAVANGTDVELALGDAIEVGQLLVKQTGTIWCDQNESVHTLGDAICFDLDADGNPLTMVEGLFPWSCAVSCIRDASASWDDVNDTLSNIGAVAQVVGEGATIVAAATGPTLVSVGAATVAALAEATALGCTIMEGLVDIVALFDSDDYLGRVTLPDQDSARYGGDYLDVDVNENPPLSAEMEISGGEAPGTYAIQTQEYMLGPADEVERNWKVWIEYKGAKQVEDSGYGGGYSSDPEDERWTFVFTRQMASVRDGIQKRSTDGDVKWVWGPTLEADNVTCNCRIHWGVDGFKTVTWVPGVWGTALITPL